MGYESRLYIVEVWDVPTMGKPYGEVIASINMCKMPSDFSKLFINPIEYNCYLNSDEEYTKTDRYGDPIKDTDISTVINWLNNYIIKGKHYRRILPLYGLLSGFDETEWDNLRIVHFGY